MGRIQNMIGMAVLVLLVASCKLGKEYARPELNLPETIDEQAADSVSVGAISWKTLSHRWSSERRDGSWTWLASVPWISTLPLSW